MFARILIVRLGSLGDLVHTLPAVSALRHANPGSRVDWLVDAVHREFLDLVPVLTSVITLKERGARGWLAARGELGAVNYDLAIDFQGLLKSAALSRLSGARQVAGFSRAALREPIAAAFYTERVAVDPATHVIDKNLRLAAALGAPSAALEFPIGTVRSPAIKDFVERLGGPLALINPGAAWPNKRWPPDRFGEVAAALAVRHGLRPVIVWGPNEEALARTVVDASGGASVLAPKTGLTELIALSRAAALIVSGDTGPLHIAAALGVPAVAIFGPTNPARNGPWDPEDVTISKYDACGCHYVRRCRRAARDWCLQHITVSDVVAAADERLRRASVAGRLAKRPS